MITSQEFKKEFYLTLNRIEEEGKEGFRLKTENHYNYTTNSIAHHVWQVAYHDAKRESEKGKPFNDGYIAFYEDQFATNPYDTIYALTSYKKWEEGYEFAKNEYFETSEEAEDYSI